MKKCALFVLACLLVAAAVGWAGGSKESASAGSSSRGQYLAGQGIIIPSGDVRIDSYIAAVDYSYPMPESGVGVTVYSGNRQLSTRGQEEIIQVGIQSAKTAFEKLPPMNLAFVIDKSGSMSSANKMDWVKDAFEIFIERVRDVDFVSLVVFDSTAKVVFPSTKMNSRQKRLSFDRAVQAVNPGGGTNLVDGLKLGYEQVMANYRKEYTNRVLFLTDGVGESQGILDMAANFSAMGIEVSTIGVGTNFDTKLMDAIAQAGGGSSRFIADRESMQETFGSELDRMVVPSASDLQMHLELPAGFTVLETWGYQAQVRGRESSYALSTLHHGDYETILARIKVPSGLPAGVGELARFTLTWKDLDGMAHTVGPLVLQAEFVDAVDPVAGFSDAMVLKSGSMLHFAQSILTIGDLYYSCRDDYNKLNSLRDTAWKARAESGVAYEDITSPEIQKLETSVTSRMQRAMDLTVQSRKELLNAKLRLDNEGFDDEIGILDKYLEILGREMKVDSAKVAAIRSDTEIKPTVTNRSLEEQAAHLFREIGLSMASARPGVIAISGFADREGTQTALTDLLNELAVVEIAHLDTHRVVERGQLDAVMKEQKLQLSALVDTDTAIEVGKLVAATYILTGTVVPMPSSVMVFARIIDVESAEIQAVAQVIMPRSPEVEALL